MDDRQPTSRRRLDISLISRGQRDGPSKRAIAKMQFLISAIEPDDLNVIARIETGQLPDESAPNEQLAAKAYDQVGVALDQDNQQWDEQESLFSEKDLITMKAAELRENIDRVDVAKKNEAIERGLLSALSHGIGVVVKSITGVFTSKKR